MIPMNYKDLRSTSRCLATQIENNSISNILYYLCLLLIFFHSLSITQDQEQVGTCTKLHLEISTKIYQQTPTLNNTVTDMKHATLIGYSSADVIKLWYLTNNKSMRSPSICLAMRIDMNGLSNSEYHHFFD